LQESGFLLAWRKFFRVLASCFARRIDEIHLMKAISVASNDHGACEEFSSDGAATVASNDIS